jgi:tyrosyl-tRNA synthetase
MFGFKKENINTDLKKIEEILTRGVEDVFVVESLKKRLLSGKQQRVKLGFDPTGSKIHIGRAVILRKLKAFQDLGHKVVFIVGDFTAEIGDPSDKLEKRPMLDRSKILENLKDYKNQVGKIIDISKAEFCFNSKWLSKLGFHEIGQLAESFSVQQMSNRRNFKDRLEKGEEVSLREFLYPIMQGYDSVVVNADIELGGFDQLFNLKAGRIIQRHYGKPEQDVLTIKMLEGTDGRKMSTSWGNVINIVDEPNDMFGKVMSVKDELIIKYFTLCTDLSNKDISEIEHSLSSGANPRDLKIKLAHEIVKIYHGDKKADTAKENFENTFSKGGIPDEVVEVNATREEKLIDVFLDKKIVSSKSEYRRLVSEGAVTNMDADIKVTDPDSLVSNVTYRVGKRRFVKIKL